MPVHHLVHVKHWCIVFAYINTYISVKYQTLNMHTVFWRALICYLLWLYHLVPVGFVRSIYPQCVLWPYKGILHDEVIKWKHFPRYWPFVRGIHRSPVDSPHKGQWRGALMFSLNCAWINGWVNNREAGDLRRHRAHYDVILMIFCALFCIPDGIFCK